MHTLCCPCEVVKFIVFDQSYPIAKITKVNQKSFGLGFYKSLQIGEIFHKYNYTDTVAMCVITFCIVNIIMVKLL